MTGNEGLENSTPVVSLVPDLDSYKDKNFFVLYIKKHYD